MNRNRILVLAGVGGVGLIIALAVAWWLVSPLFLNRSVDEAFPEVPSDTGVDQMTEQEKEPPTEEATPMPDVVMEEPMPEEMEETEPVVVWQGQFQNADDFHMGSGSATIYQLPDGNYVLRLENFEVTNGPDLHVHLSGAAFPLTQDEVMSGPGLDLGPLKGNIGDQNYDIPAGTDISTIGSVVIYCQPFHVTFAVATAG